MMGSPLRVLLALPLALALRVDVSRPRTNDWKRTQCGGPSGSADLPTQWAAQVTTTSPPLPEFPRPSLVRGGSDRDRGNQSTWSTLNGIWEYAPAEPTAPPPTGKTLEQSILVPFPIESCLSGVAPNSTAAYVNRSWYRLEVTVTATAGTRQLLHFEAANWQTTVYVNGRLLGNHSGGYDRFSVELTHEIFGASASLSASSGTASATLELLIGVYNPADRGAQPNGKARISAITSPGGDTYTPASGLWQSVWIEEVPAAFIASVQLDANTSHLTATARIDDASVSAANMVKFEVIDPASKAVVASGHSLAGSPLRLAIPSARLWSPGAPFLYDLRVSCDACHDAVLAYFGMRTFTVANVTTPSSGGYTQVHAALVKGGDLLVANLTVKQAEAKCDATAGCVGFTFEASASAGVHRTYLKGGQLKFTQPAAEAWQSFVKLPAKMPRPLLNGGKIFLAGWLDQSYWPDGIYTAPTEAALTFDLEAVRTFGLNTVRLHQKVNSERWYYAADRLGVLIMQDAVQKYGRASNATIPLFESDLKRMIEQRSNHPSIVQWETFNEQDCWQVFKTAPHAVADIVRLARATDGQHRPVDTDSGGGANGLPVGDVNDIHSYPYPRPVLPTARRYAMIGEFGGIGYFARGREWVPGKCHTYLNASSPAKEADIYVNMTRQMIDLAPTGLSASIYTQITDVELECDGFLNYDRTSKFTPAQTAAIREANEKLIAVASAQ